MAQYDSVVWDEDDEIVSDKLQQMADNETFLRDNCLFPFGFSPTGIIGGSVDVENVKLQAGSTVVILTAPGSPSVEAESQIFFPTVFPNGIISIVAINGDAEAIPARCVVSVKAAEIVPYNIGLDHFVAHLYDPLGGNLTGVTARVNWFALGW